MPSLPQLVGKRAVTANCGAYVGAYPPHKQGPMELFQLQTVVTHLAEPGTRSFGKRYPENFATTLLLFAFRPFLFILIRVLTGPNNRVTFGVSRPFPHFMPVLIPFSIGEYCLPLTGRRMNKNEKSIPPIAVLG